jgi:hypothetical protein
LEEIIIIIIIINTTNAIDTTLAIITKIWRPIAESEK